MLTLKTDDNKLIRLVFRYENIKASSAAEASTAMGDILIFKCFSPRRTKNKDQDWRTIGAAFYIKADDIAAEFECLILPASVVCAPEDRYVKAAGRKLAAARLRTNLVKAYRNKNIPLNYFKVAMQLVNKWV